MKKRILLSLAAVVALAIGVVGMSAYEAHVINVTAQIENALNVPLDEIDFGTVFPQEELDRPFDISLSGSFIDEDRVEDVVYIIRQKPKCAVTIDDGEILAGPTATGHIIVGDNPATQDVVETYWIDCGETPRPLVTGETWGVLPSLCEYLSKHQTDPNETRKIEVPAFHKPFTIVEDTVNYKEAAGYLSKLNQDVTDTWNIDLKVPCFGSQCAQDWADFVHEFNPNVNPDNYVQPTENEHKVFGCDLWIEVTSVSEHTPECADENDNDGDGLVDYPEDPGCESLTDDSESSDQDA